MRPCPNDPFICILSSILPTLGHAVVQVSSVRAGVWFLPQTEPATNPVLRPAHSPQTMYPIAIHNTLMLFATPPIWIMQLGLPRCSPLLGRLLQAKRMGARR